MILPHKTGTIVFVLASRDMSLQEVQNVNHHYIIENI